MNSTTSKITRCFSNEMLLLMTDVEKRINQVFQCSVLQFLFPIQFFVAIIGNTLTMSVLLSSHMKNRANHLLAFLALSDILVFIMMFPHYMAALDVFSYNVQFRFVHFRTKVHFAALTNWFSAAAIWFVLSVSVERLLIVKFPFRSLDGYNSRQTLFVSIGIFLGTFLLTSYHHVSHVCKTWLTCSGTQLIGICYSNAVPMWGSKSNPTSAFTRQWIELSVLLNAVFAVLLPVFAVAALNISLVRLLKKRNTQELLVHTVSANPEVVHEQERKMTNTVLAIVTCFSITQGPSAIMFIYQLLYPLTSPTLRNMSIVANQLVLTGKMLNVVLFCMTSSTFRRKLIQTLKKWIYTALSCNRRKHVRSNFLRSQSKSLVTQRTSLMYSHCSRHRRPSISSEMSQRKCSQPDYNSPPVHMENI